MPPIFVYTIARAPQSARHSQTVAQRLTTMYEDQMQPHERGDMWHVTYREQVQENTARHQKECIKITEVWWETNTSSTNGDKVTYIHATATPQSSFSPPCWEQYGGCMLQSFWINCQLQGCDNSTWQHTIEQLHLSPVAILNSNRIAWGASSKFESTVMPVIVLQICKRFWNIRQNLTWSAFHARKKSLTNDGKQYNAERKKYDGKWKLSNRLFHTETCFRQHHAQ